MRYLVIIKRLAFISLLITPVMAGAQPAFKGLENLFAPPLNYLVRHTSVPPVIDGDINDKVWQNADWTAQFQDIEGDLKLHPSLQTQVKMLWDDSCLYIAARLQEPNVWAYVRHRDEVVFHDNDFEVFINPNNTTHQYFEFEVNAINTIFDLFLNKPYRDLGDAMISWDATGLRTAVKVQGTLNDPSDTDQGWTVEMAIPLKSVNIGNYMHLPKEGSLWRINFSRVEWDTKLLNGKYIKETDANGYPKPEHNWVWSPQGIVNMHFPERWGYLQFTKKDSGKVTFSLPYAELQKRYLWLVYYREKICEQKHYKFLSTLKKLGLKGKVMVNNRPNILKLEATDHQFMALISDKADGIIWTINTEGLIQQLFTGKHE